MNGTRPLEMWIGATVSLVAVALVLVMLGAERVRVTHEIHLRAPLSVAPRDPIPFHALVLTGLDGAEVPTLDTGELSLELVEGAGVVVDRAEVQVLATEGATGTLTAPDGAGELELRGRLMREGRVVATVTRLLSVALEVPHAPSQPLRLAPTQRLVVGPGVARSAEITPVTADVRVEGGTCIPDLPCRLLLEVDDERATLALESCESVDARAVDPQFGRRRRVELLGHSADASCELVAQRDGELVSSQTLRLPILLAAPRLTTDPADPTRLRVMLPPGAERATVDVFERGRWRATHVLEGDEEVPLPSRDHPALYRVQAAAGILPSDIVFSRHVAVPDPREAMDEVVAELGVRADDYDELTWAAAPREASFLAVPDPVTGYEGDQRALEGRRKIVRWTALVAALLSIGLLGFALARRGAEANRTAAAIMSDAGIDEETAARERPRAVLTVVAASVSLVLAFLVGLAFVLARSLVGSL